jgi:hypothetical protein
MPYAHGPDGRSQTQGFLFIHRQGPSGLYGTELTGAGTDLSKDHESGCTSGPAFAYIGTLATGTDGMQFMQVDLCLYLHITVTSRHLHTHPVRQALPSLQVHCAVSSFHPAKIVRNMLN